MPILTSANVTDFTTGFTTGIQGLVDLVIIASPFLILAGFAYAAYRYIKKLASCQVSDRKVRVINSTADLNLTPPPSSYDKGEKGLWSFIDIEEQIAQEKKAGAIINPKFRKRLDDIRATVFESKKKAY
jgi:hypothetical protein